MTGRARRRVDRRVALTITGMLVWLALAGCASLPDESDINSGTVAGVDKAGSVISNSPAPAQDGQTREEVIAGYLHAMAAYPTDPSIVRSFLTPGAGARWNPETRVQVYEDASIDLVRGSYHLTATILGTIDTRGSWTSKPADQSPFDLPVSLARVGGQWRINNPPPG